MKKRIFFSLAAATLAIAGCGGGKTTTTDASVPPGMQAMDLSKYGKNIIINIPDSTNGSIAVDNSMGDMIRISVGKTFQIDVKEGEGNMDMKKNEDIKKNEVYKFDNFDIDEPDAIIWSWHMDGRTTADGKPSIEFNLYSLRKIGTVTYEVESVAGEIFSLDACKKMLESAKSIHAKENKKPDA